MDKKVLLLGGLQHLRTVLVHDGFPTPISHCGEQPLPERYHRAVFYPSVASSPVGGAWYVYVTESYRLGQGQLTEAMLIDQLQKSGIEPHMPSVEIEDIALQERLAPSRGE